MYSRIESNRADVGLPTIRFLSRRGVSGIDSGHVVRTVKKKIGKSHADERNHRSGLTRLSLRYSRTLRISIESHRILLRDRNERMYFKDDATRRP